MKPFTHHPPVHYAPTIGMEARHAIRSALVRDPQATNAPMLLRQTMVRVGRQFHLLSGIDVFQANGESFETVSIAGSGIAGAAELALALTEERDLADHLAKTVARERLGYDNFMMEEAMIDVLHFPGAVAIGWDMTPQRMKKLIKNQPQGQPPAMRSNNPAAALGVIVLEAAASNHARLDQAAALADARARLGHWVSFRARDIPIALADPVFYEEE